MQISAGHDGRRDRPRRGGRNGARHGGSATPGLVGLSRAPPRIESALLSAMNRARVHRGLRPLRSIRTLRRPARGQSRYLRRIGTLDHSGADGSPFWTRLIAAGYPRGRSLGENLAMVPGCGRNVAARAVRMWLKSPGHRANLLNPAFRWTGAGVAVGSGCSATFVTADYGS